MVDTAMTSQVMIVPASEASWDIQAVFGARGDAHEAAGFKEVSHPTLRRVVMRIDF